MMAQSPQAGVYRPQMSPMNMMSKILLICICYCI
jgi:hypothetical protein